MGRNHDRALVRSGSAARALRSDRTRESATRPESRPAGSSSGVPWTTCPSASSAFQCTVAKTECSPSWRASISTGRPLPGARRGSDRPRSPKRSDHARRRGPAGGSPPLSGCATNGQRQRFVDPFRVAFRVAAGVLVEERVDRGGQEEHGGSRSHPGQSRASPTRTSARQCVRVSLGCHPIASSA